MGVGLLQEALLIPQPWGGVAESWTRRTTKRFCSGLSPENADPQLKSVANPMTLEGAALTHTSQNRKETEASPQEAFGDQDLVAP